MKPQKVKVLEQIIQMCSGWNSVTQMRLYKKLQIYSQNTYIQRFEEQSILRFKYQTLPEQRDSLHSQHEMPH